MHLFIDQEFDERYYGNTSSIFTGCPFMSKTFSRCKEKAWKKLLKYYTALNEEEMYISSIALFINKSFALNEMFQQNASKFAIFYV